MEIQHKVSLVVTSFSHSKSEYLFVFFCIEKHHYKFCSAGIVSKKTKITVSLNDVDYYITEETCNICFNCLMLWFSPENNKKGENFLQIYVNEMLWPPQILGSIEHPRIS